MQNIESKATEEEHHQLPSSQTISEDIGAEEETAVIRMELAVPIFSGEISGREDRHNGGDVCVTRRTHNSAK